ncbi:GIY-YIG nuclease family protein, partial [Candidatus Omnitrophota bacterium]
PSRNELPNFAMWHIYIIEKNSKYYTGITSDLNNRLRQHGNPPLLFKETFSDKYQAAKKEKKIKAWSRINKERLIAKFGK